MEHQRLTQFFNKHPQQFNVMTAVKLIHKTVEEGQECLKKKPESKEYLKYLKEAAVMISDLFTEIGANPNEY
jgi:hypothetical protein